MSEVEAFILAGGASSRMGTDKSRLTLEGQTFIERIAETLFKVSSKVTVVGAKSAEFGLETVPDIYPKWGALGGVHTALSTSQSKWALVVACDLPFVTPELCKLLISLTEMFEAVVPVQPDRIPQPLCALYQIGPCLAQATRLINEGHRRPLDLLNSVNTRWVEFAELADLDGADKFFVNINTPEDYYEISRKGVLGDWAR